MTKEISILFILILSCYPLLMQAKGIKIMARQIDTNLDPHYLEIAQLALNMTKRFISPHTNTLVITSLCSVHCIFHRRYHRNLLDTFLRDINLNISVKLNFDEPEDKPWEYNLLLVDSWYALKLSIHTRTLSPLPKTYETLY